MTATKSPESVALANLRHLYTQMIRGQVGSSDKAALGLLGPAIEALEPLVDRAVSDSVRDENWGAFVLAESLFHTIGDAPSGVTMTLESAGGRKVEVTIRRVGPGVKTTQEVIEEMRQVLVGIEATARKASEIAVPTPPLA